MLPILRLYYSLMPNILAFRTPNVSGFLVFGVPNAKDLAFDTSDGNALTNDFLFFPILSLQFKGRTFCHF